MIDDTDKGRTSSGVRAREQVQTSSSMGYSDKDCVGSEDLNIYTME